ncbi:MAG: hypothetical protein QW076_06285, partial [Candidatus Anstonellales archaeon]
MKVKEISKDEVLRIISIIREVQEIYLQILEYEKKLSEKYKNLEEYKRNMSKLTNAMHKYEQKKKELIKEKQIISDNLASTKKRLVELMEKEEEIARNQRSIESFNIEITTLRANI